MSNISKQFKEKYNLEGSAIRECGDKGIYKSMGMSFHIDQTLTKDEGRKFLFKLLKEFLNEINNNKEFEQYMIDYPFTEKNISIGLFAMGKDKVGSFYPNILTFCWDGQKFRYFTYLKNGIGHYSMENESFEEAKRIVESQD